MPNKIKKAANDRTALIGGIISIIENKLGAAQNDLFKKLISDLVDNLDREGDQIKNTLRNKRMIALVDNVFTDYAKGKGLEVAASVIKGVSQVMDFNGKYFEVFTEPAKLAPIHDVVKGNLTDWLGISKTGKVQPNGYLDTLINDPNIKNQVKDLTVKSVFNQAGYQETKKILSDFVTGNEETGGVGAMKKYYRNFVYDTFSQIDRTSGKLYADKLQLNYAIYEGGLVEKSRKFCIDRNGKVFTREEIAEFDPPEAKPPGYNPFFDLGGYGCRHHLNWIPDAVAFALRPDLRNGATPVEPVETPKDGPKPTAQTAAKTKPAPKPKKDQPAIPTKTSILKQQRELENKLKAVGRLK